MSAKPKRKTRKVVVWAVVDEFGTQMAHYANEADAEWMVSGKSNWRVVRCEGVLR